MPLLYITDDNLCSATARSTGKPCKNPKAFGCRTCRVHGAHRSRNVQRGTDHYNFKDGERTRSKVNARSRSRREIREILALGLQHGIFINPRTGKPAKSKRALDIPPPGSKRKAKR